MKWLRSYVLQLIALYYIQHIKSWGWQNYVISDSISLTSFLKYGGFGMRSGVDQTKLSTDAGA